MGEEITDYTDQTNSASFLESFNIDTGAAAAPHYIVNLDSFQPVPDGAFETEAVDAATAQDVANDNTNISIPTLPTYAPFMSIGAKSRVRGSYKPLNEMVETRIRTYEGADSHTKIATLQQHFPTFKKGMIDRCFTKNLLDFEKAYTELFLIQKQQQEARSKIKLILTPKIEKNRIPRVIPNIKSPELINSPQNRGRPNRRAENKYYRRVIVGKDGSVAPADITEKNFIQAADNNRSPGYAIPRIPNRPLISYPGLPLSEKANFFNEPPEVPENDIKPFLGTIKPDQATPIASTSQQVDQPKTVTTEDTPVNIDSVVAPVITGNKFFRSNRLSGAELKKRTYVTKEMLAPAQGRTRSSVTTKHEPDSSEPSENSAANFMAGVGVVSTPVTRGKRRTGGGGRKTKRHASTINPSTKSVEQPESEEDEEANDGLDLSREERKLLLAFFNEAPANELNLMPGCSQKTAEIIMNMRPFKNTVDLKLRLGATRYLSTNLVDACKELMQSRSMFSSLLQSCESISSRVVNRLGALLNDSINLPDSGEVAEEETSDKEEYIRSKKTAFIHEQPVILHPLRQLKPYQLVGLNWLRILHEEKVNGILADEMGLGKTVQAIAFLAYLYENGERGPHLIMCPSSTVENWKRELHNWCAALKVIVYQGAADQRKAMRLKIYECGSKYDFNVILTSYNIGTCSLEDRALMKRVDFQYGIFDEAHMLKNVTTQRYKTLSGFQVQRRILLTGTPLQNNLTELISLLAFVMPSLFSSNASHLKRVFKLMGKSVADGAEANSDETKNQDGTSMMENGIGQDLLIEANNDSILIPNRSQFEREILDKARLLLKPFSLRRLKSQVLSQLPPKTEETVHVAFTDGQRQSYISLVHKFRNAHKASVNEEDQMYDEDDEASKSNSLLNRSGAPGKRNGEPPAKKGKKASELEEVSAADCDLKLTPFNMLMQLRKASNHQLLLSGIAYTEENLKELSVVLHSDPSHADADPALVLEDLRILSDHQVHNVCRLYDILNPFSLPPEALIEGSGKIKWLDDNLPQILKDGHRILIFSQFVILLDILSEYLVYRGNKFLRFDGSTPVTDRQTLIDTFNNDETYEIFLLSTKAGGLGITLTGADVVIIHDIDFNPYNDRQAADRCHRVGQTKPVRVLRLVSSASVEESIWRSAEDKLRLEEDVVAEIAVPEVSSSVAASTPSGGKRVADQNGILGPQMGENSPRTAYPQTAVSLSSGKQILQGEIIKFLSDALTLEGDQIGSPRCT